jgi:Fe-S-cluster-containing dehydrogenase component
MAKISMAIDLDMCTGCFACENACKMVNDLEPGTRWLRIIPQDWTPEEIGGKLYMDRFPHPATLKTCLACPDRAAALKEAGTGSDEEKSLYATPEAAEMRMSQPLCARSCMGEALFVGDPEKAAKFVEGKRSVVYTL